MNHLLSSNENYGTTKDVVDAIADFFAAGTLTSQSATINIISYLIKNKDSLKRVREEFEDYLTKKKLENPALNAMKREDQVYEILNQDMIDSLEYLNMVIKEGIRFRVPTP